MHKTVLELLQARLSEKHGVPVKLEFSTKPFDVAYGKFIHQLSIDITVDGVRIRNGVETVSKDRYLTVEAAKGMREAADEWIASQTKTTTEDE